MRLTRYRNTSRLHHTFWYCLLSLHHSVTHEACGPGKPITVERDPLRVPVIVLPRLNVIVTPKTLQCLRGLCVQTLWTIIRALRLEENNSAGTQFFNQVKEKDLSYFKLQIVLLGSVWTQFPRLGVEKVWKKKPFHYDFSFLSHLRLSESKLDRFLNKIKIKQG